MRTLQWRLAPDHDPLAHLVTGNDAVNRRAGDGLFVRLLDVEAALSARTYATVSTSCSSSTTRSARGTAATACATALRAHGRPADLALGAEALGAIYLGGTPVTALAAAGRMRELRPGALLEAATAFRSAVEPWCPEIF